MERLFDKDYFNRIIEKRSSGILLPVFSLYGDYGIGTFGKEAREFIDFLDQTGQSYWQILPLGQTSYGDSPYQTFSSFAFSYYYIDLENLKKDGYLSQKDLDRVKEIYKDDSYIDYEKLYKERLETLKIAFLRFDRNNKDFKDFVKDNSYWLDDYALFMSLKKMNEDMALSDWKLKAKKRENEYIEEVKIKKKEEIDFYKFLQFLAIKQWKELKRYANDKGIKIIGDLAFYVSSDSSEVFSRPDLFCVDEDLEKVFVGGCPPDAFTEDGQLWGNPCYKWENHLKDDFTWWINRLSFALENFDLIRLDHFRAFYDYWKIHASDKTARGGHWEKSPGRDLFIRAKEQIGDLKILAEDLGALTDGVYKLIEWTGFPGMKVLEFAFEESMTSPYLPHNIEEKSIAYLGSHDNETANGWYEGLDENTRKLATSYLGLNKEEGINWGLMRSLASSRARLTIFQFQDLLGLGNIARINKPGSLGDNWTYRCKKEDFSQELKDKFKKFTFIYGRDN